MKSVLIRAKQYLPTASGAEQGALRYLLEHSEEIPQLSVKELSQRSFRLRGDHCAPVQKAGI